MVVSDFMRENFAMVAPNAEFKNVIDVFNSEKTDSVLIVNKEMEALGIISRSHALKELSKGVDLATSVQNIMVKEIISIKPDIPIDDLITWNVSSLPVIKDKKVLGLITLSETIHAYNSYILNLKLDLEAVLNGVYNGIISIDRDKKIQIINHSALKIFGLKNYNDVIGKNIEDIIKSDLISEVVDSEIEFFNKRIVVNGKSLMVTCSLIKDYRDNKSGAVAIFQDSTELEKVYAQLFKTKELKNELGAIIESSFDGILVTDLKGDIRVINTSLAKLLGIEDENLLIGKNIEFMSSYLDIAFLSELKNNKEAITTSFKLESGTEIIITANPIIGEKGTIDGMVANVRDISNLRILEDKITKLNELYTRQVKKDEIYKDFVFESPASKKMLNTALQVALVDSTVLVTGESGVGKEIITNIIYQNSSRKDQPFVKINCGALPSNLMESELFGYEAGSFTGANKDGKIGLWEIANKGTLLLDEIGDLPLELQVKVLRALQEGEIMRVGSIKPIKIDVRIIASTNRDLKQMVNDGLFRADLYYRLNVVPLEVPSLRDRKMEIPSFIKLFIDKYNSKYGMSKKFASNTIDEMYQYNWPGNVRELENVIERSMVTSTSDIVDDIKIEYDDALNGFQSSCNLSNLENKGYKESVAIFEKEILMLALNKYKTTRAAGKALGLHQSTIVKKAAKFNIPLIKNDDDV
ncbi:MAG: sigma 54-interacting transcriptional regulator [Anaerovoracaceae bacterium]|jgi:PAS domain S-box-containing protein|nr:sigma 54-interacting transcriptional regulator [Anaerovoracaceae bacterium]